MTIKAGDGVVFRLWDTNGRTRGYAAGVVREITKNCVSVRDVHSTVDMTRANGSMGLPARVLHSNVILFTAEPSDSRDLSDRLNAISAEESAALEELPQLFERLRQTAIHEALVEGKAR